MNSIVSNPLASPEQRDETTSLTEPEQNLSKISNKDFFCYSFEKSCLKNQPPCEIISYRDTTYGKFWPKDIDSAYLIREMNYRLLFGFRWDIVETHHKHCRCCSSFYIFHCCHIIPLECCQMCCYCFTLKLCTPDAHPDDDDWGICYEASCYCCIPCHALSQSCFLLSLPCFLLNLCSEGLCKR